MIKIWTRELYLKQRLCWSHWIATVRNDDIEFTLSLFHVFKTIATSQMHLFRIESTCHEWKILFGHFNDSIINFDLMNFLNQRMFDDCEYFFYGQNVCFYYRMTQKIPSRATPPSPPPMIRTFFGFGWQHNGMNEIIS